MFFAYEELQNMDPFRLSVGRKSYPVMNNFSSFLPFFHANASVLVVIKSSIFVLLFKSSYDELWLIKKLLLKHSFIMSDAHK